MKNFLSVSDISKHKRLHKDWINCFDAYSKDVTISGILPKDEFWTKELPNQRKEETIFIYGVNSAKQSFSLRLTTRPRIDEKSDQIICIQYKYEIYFDKQNENYYKCEESGILYNISQNQYKFPGLVLEVLEPFQKWRIKFNGFVWDKNNLQVFARIRLLWFSNSEVFDFRTNCDTNYLSKQLNGFQLKIDDIFEDRYVGCGQLKGVFNLNNEGEDELFLWGSRSKSWRLGTGADFEHNYQKCHLMAYSEKGIAFEIIKITDKSSDKIMHYGWALGSQGTVFPIENFIFETDFNNEKQSLFPKCFELTLNGKKIFVKDLSLRENKICDLNVNGRKGSGILMDTKDIFGQLEPIEPNMDLVNMFKVEESQELVLGFDSTLGFNESTTGGKGSSLCLLRSLSKFKTDKSFVVPNGFIVTTNAYEMFLRENPVLNKAIENLQTISWSGNRDDLKTECENVMNLFTRTKIPFLVMASVRDSLTDINGNYEDILVAVRSSACGEDSEDMSAAGQMTTYLGVKGLDEICHSVLKCWSSQFNIIAVEYKRGYGQVINSAMAVVVQQMVDCDVAGVMFTCDPLNGAPNKVSINANYGIGESVVSASVNPDNITLLVDMKSNSLDDRRSVHSIHDVIIGAKESAIKISKTSGSGTEIKTNTTIGDKCCLTDEQMKTLGEIGLQLQRYFGSARDIEWGLKDGAYHVFQSRPVTNLNAYNEWELTHEMDHGQLDETEYNSRANLGEVMPGAMSPIFSTCILKAMWIYVSDKCLKNFNLKYNPIRKVAEGMTMNNYTVFFSLKDASFFDFAPEGRESFLHKALILAVFGHPVEDEQLRADAFERNGTKSLKTKISLQTTALKNLMFSMKELKALISRKEGLDLRKVQNYENSRQMFDVLAQNLPLISEILMCHMNVSTKSSVWNLLLMAVLSNGEIDIEKNPNLLIDFANLLSTTGNSVVSADVPTAIRSLAKSIEEPEVFKSMSVEEALNWIEGNDKESGKLYKQFMQDFGVRGYKEWDVMSKTWSDNKHPLVETIQRMLPLKENQNMSSDNMFDKIKTKISRKQKYLIKNWILPASHRAVAHREVSKMFDIKCIDIFRQFFREMAKRMCYKEGRIPDPELIWFLTFSELKVLSEFRDSKIVMKAKQRKKIFAKLDRNLYPEMCIGPDVRPRNFVDKSTIKAMNGTNTTLKGTPVCTGSVTGKVCVAKCFDEAKNLESGDILVTYSTDIGWSPYLPMISGIITEIGGLVSHGAVISREYGIPCLVGVVNACEVLTSGDTVLLDADNSQIILVKSSSNETIR